MKGRKSNNKQVHVREKGQGLNFESICQLLGFNNDDNANNNKKRKRVQRYISKCVEEKLIEEANGKYRLASRYKSTWPRIKKLVTKIGDQIFYGDKEPFMIRKESADSSDSGSQYGSKDENKKKKSKDKELITTLDLAFLTLFTLYMLIEECWKKNILLIGITKDSAAHDFKNHVIPICVCNDIWMGDDADDNNKMTQDDLDNIPNTDRMLLQSISMFNHQKVSLPWALVEYDAAFVMAIPDFKKRKGYVSGAIRNKITPSQLFLRSFVQLEKAKQDNMLRSNVLSIDRLVYPVFDLAPIASDGTERVTKEFLHEYGSDESIKFILFRNSKVRNDIQNLVLNILKGMCCPSVPETFGHNQALYIADKVAKWHNEQFGNMVDSTGALIFCDKGLRKFVFYMNTFRERRGVFESSRRTA